MHCNLAATLSLRPLHCCADLCSTRGAAVAAKRRPSACMRPFSQRTCCLHQSMRPFNVLATTLSLVLRSNNHWDLGRLIGMRIIIDLMHGALTVQLGSLTPCGCSP